MVAALVCLTALGVSPTSALEQTVRALTVGLRAENERRITPTSSDGTDLTGKKSPDDISAS